jgi:hypothetical protein
LFLRDANTQIRYDAYHRRGWSDAHRPNVEDLPVGCGAVKGRERNDRDTA